MKVDLRDGALLSRIGPAVVVAVAVLVGFLLAPGPDQRELLLQDTQLSEAAEAEAQGFFYERQEPHKGDLGEMRERGVVRALVTLNMTEFFLLKGQPRGFEYELLQGYEKFLNESLPKGASRTQVVFIPVAFEEAIEALRDGRGDLIAAGMTVTPERRKRVAFTKPYFSDVSEIVVAHEDVEGLTALEDLAGRQVTVLAGSSYAEHLRELSDELEDQDLSPIEVVEADPLLAGDDLLRMVNAGIYEITVSDDHVAKLWAEVLDDIVLHDTLAVNSGGRIAWAVRKNNRGLRKSLDAYLADNKKGTLIGNVLFKRYYENSRFINNPLAGSEIRKFEKLAAIFKTYAEKYDFDWLASMAQGYQESGLDQSKRSDKGAVGVMQVLPSTAADPAVGIPNINDVENNIHAGIKYMHYLREQFFSDPKLAPEDRLAFSLAAYNMGPGRVAEVRERAKKMGLDPNLWFGNVEMAALARVGREPVQYVKNIQEYYVAYRLHMEREAARAKADLEEIENDP